VLPPLTWPGIELLSDARWQMLPGERFALEAVLAQLKPKVAIETGIAEGGSLRRLAVHSDHVHAFDLLEQAARFGDELDNVTVHVGDSGETLPAALAALAEAGQHVDFAFVDGDHSYEGVIRDVQAILDSDACQRTVMLFHDSANDTVRAALEAFDFPRHPKVAVSLLDFVPGYLVMRGHEGGYSLAAWHGLGLVILDPEQGAETARTLGDRYNVAEIYQRVRPIYDGAVVPIPTSDVPPPYPMPGPPPGVPAADLVLRSAAPAPLPPAAPTQRSGLGVAAAALAGGVLGGLLAGLMAGRRS
jgi:hypothetical protein